MRVHKEAQTVQWTHGGVPTKFCIILVPYFTVFHKPIPCCYTTSVPVILEIYYSNFRDDQHYVTTHLFLDTLFSTNFFLL